MKGRRVVSALTSEYGPYDLEGPVQQEMGLIEVSYDRSSGEGAYLMRMAPGAITIAHEHQGYEEFFILEGELVDDDGRIFKAGDFVSFAPGTRHNSSSPSGCIIAVFEWRDA